MEEMKFEKQCQSCGMPLKNGENSGLEADGSKSIKFCELCYKDGAFIQPDMSLGEMKGIVDDALKEQGWIRPLRWMARMQLSSLERWKKK